MFKKVFVGQKSLNYKKMYILAEDNMHLGIIFKQA